MQNKLAESLSKKISDEAQAKYPFNEKGNWGTFGINECKQFARDGYTAAAEGILSNPGAYGLAGCWVKASERLPEIIDKRALARLVHVERKKWDNSGTWIQKQTAFYFPDRFKTVEWEDWDDYSQEDFPYTEEDGEKGVVWLRAGWYASVDCDKCEGHWSAPLNVIEWLAESAPPVDKVGELVNKAGVKLLFEFYCRYKNEGGQLEFNDWLDASPIHLLPF